MVKMGYRKENMKKRQMKILKIREESGKGPKEIQEDVAI